VTDSLRGAHFHDMAAGEVKPAAQALIDLMSNDGGACRPLRARRLPGSPTAPTSRDAMSSSAVTARPIEAHVPSSGQAESLITLIRDFEDVSDVAGLCRFLQ
jgi:hypothetical protein